ncbi:hypothetical protein A2456_03700 [Candidatus Nomurabacteria bacterium RIFOXYC2_FULL_36_19]|uniref:Uncharacterized protein n=1 Tax=Candidatus Nomurabacteria bacterium RIFOXYC2_FULL_36_19 TaxID=1801806 RepID=A0A1F6YT99_9BACT|nr:MAG: hypothetical protein A2238_03405 [Candidatus Nomurabacteria bacterium RIFOXYA2_FULL_35_9]OGJ09586.1 MAG: hypothetical protein A2456_03700 [Candidatus Nomurabacteria bacterium RIFOXYC2_FULL_36_19]
MSKRNFILLIIILIIITISIFGFLYFQKGTTLPADDGTDTNFFSEFNPFGSNKPTATTPTTPVDVSGYQPTNVDTQQLQLMKVSSMGIAGFVIFTKERLKDVVIPEQTIPTSEEVGTPISSKKSVGAKKPTPPATEFMPALRYVEKTTGNIYQTFIDKIEERKFTTTLIPKVYDAYFGNRGGSVVMRYLKGNERTIETFLGTMPKELLGGDSGGNTEIKGSFLPDNIKDISISPDGSKMFYLFNSGDNMIGTILNFSTNKKVQIFDSPFTEWISQWPNSGTTGTIALSTKPSANVPGYMYKMSETGKNLTKILGDINGLTTQTSPNGKLVLYSDNNLFLNVYDTNTMNSSILGIRTLPEKCVWGKLGDSIYCAVPKSIEAGDYPDTWYQGEVSFSDQFWKIDIKTGNATILIDPLAVEKGEEVDGTKLTLDSGENYLFFVNKKDNFLWKLNLK